MVEQERHRVVHLAGVDDVVVVKYQHHIGGQNGEIIQEGDEQVLHGRRVGGLQHGQLLRPDLRRHRPQR